MEGRFALPGYLQHNVNNCDYATQLYSASIICLGLAAGGIASHLVSIVILLLHQIKIVTKKPIVFGAIFFASLLTVLALVLWAALFPYGEMQGKAGVSFILMLIACILCFPACAIIIWNVSQVSQSVRPADRPTRVHTIARMPKLRPPTEH